MPLTERIEEDLKAAMKRGDAPAVSTLRMLRSSLKNREISDGAPLDESAVEALVAREIKQRRESAESYHAADRPELARKEEAEAALLGAYLPEQLSDEELGQIVQKVIAEAGEGAQMGQIIGRVRSEVGSRAEGGAIARLVQAKLGG